MTDNLEKITLALAHFRLYLLNVIFCSFFRCLGSLRLRSSSLRLRSTSSRRWTELCRSERDLSGTNAAGISTSMLYSVHQNLFLLWSPDVSTSLEAGAGGGGGTHLCVYV
jgi:hypothetical protein